MVNEKAGGEYNKAQDDSRAQMEDARLWLQIIGSEATAKVPVINLETLASPKDVKTPHVVALAGIEGQAGVFNDLAKKLKIRVTCFQFCVNSQLETIEDMALSLLGVSYTKEIL